MKIEDGHESRNVRSWKLFLITLTIVINWTKFHNSVTCSNLPRLLLNLSKWFKWNDLTIDAEFCGVNVKQIMRHRKLLSNLLNHYLNEDCRNHGRNKLQNFLLIKLARETDFQFQIIAY